MNSKTLIQMILTILVIIISGIIYYQYFYKIKVGEEDKTFKNENSKVTVNVIKDIAYTSFDNNGNTYIIKSDYGEVNEENKDIIFMSKVVAEMNFDNGTTAYLKSENANYNTSNNDTNFLNNVELIYLNHKINADNMDIFFKNSVLEAYNNLVYSNPDISLIADKVKINLKTKDTKIFMLNNEKVKVINSN